MSKVAPNVNCLQFDINEMPFCCGGNVVGEFDVAYNVYDFEDEDALPDEYTEDDEGDSYPNPEYNNAKIDWSLLDKAVLTHFKTNWKYTLQVERVCFLVATTVPTMDIVEKILKGSGWSAVNTSTSPRTNNDITTWIFSE